MSLRIPNSLLLLLFAAALVGATPFISSAMAGKTSANSGKCNTVSSDEYICGPISAEELVQLKGTEWVFGSLMLREFLKLPEGKIHLVNSRTREWMALSVDGKQEDFDSTTYGDCPSVLIGSTFSGHGMTISYPANSAPILYAVNHAQGREAVEVFRVDISADQPTLTWIGCIRSPGDDYINTLTALPEGGIAATKFFETENWANWLTDMMAGKPTGEIYEWHPGKGWEMVPGTRMSGPNGIALTDDGHYIVAEWGNQRLHKFPRSGFEGAVTVSVSGWPDNLHWSSDGSLLVVAQTIKDMGPFGKCIVTTEPVCPGTFDVIAIDADKMELDVILSFDKWDGEFAYGTSALIIDGKLWIGTVRGNKIATLDFDK